MRRMITPKDIVTKAIEEALESKVLHEESGDKREAKKLQSLIEDLENILNLI